MTAVTLHFEDNLFHHLKQSADKVDYSIDNYILHVLSKNYKESDEKREEDNLDDRLYSMQFHGVSIPIEENGKGSLSETKYM